jgi:hypothetical protein
VTNRKVYVFLSVAGVLIAAYALFRVFHSDAALPVKSGGAESAPISSIDESARQSPVDVREPQAKPTRNGTVSNDEAKALFRKTQNCYFHHNQIALLSNQTDCKAIEGKRGLEKQYGECLNNVATAQQRISTIRAAMTECGADKQIARYYFNATKAAAKTGDVDAQVCYIQSAFSDSEGNMQYSTEDVAQFKSDAPGYIADAIARGDWRIVYFLSLKRLSPAFGLAAYIDGAGSLETAYRMNSLLLLGADDDYRSTVKVLLDSIPQSGAPAGQELSPEKLASAQEWAKNTYDQHFSATERLTRSPIVCGPEGE